MNKEYKTVPNQRIVKMPAIGERIRDKEHLYGMFSIDEAQKVAKELGASAFVLYMYFQKNQDCYEFALSKVDVEAWGLGKTAYTNAFNALAAHGYLVRKSENSNYYYFHESPEIDDDGKPVVVLHNHEDDNEKSRGNATIPRVVMEHNHAWQDDNTTRGNAALPEIIHNNTINNKINNTIYCDASASLGSAASGAAESSKEKDKKEIEANQEAYRKEMIVLNDKFFDGVQAYKAKFGDDYSNHTEYIVWREGIAAETEALKKKYNIGQKQ